MVKFFFKYSRLRAILEVAKEMRKRDEQHLKALTEVRFINRFITHWKRHINNLIILQCTFYKDYH